MARCCAEAGRCSFLLVNKTRVKYEGKLDGKIKYGLDWKRICNFDGCIFSQVILMAVDQWNRSCRNLG